MPIISRWVILPGPSEVDRTAIRVTNFASFREARRASALLCNPCMSSTSLRDADRSNLFFMSHKAMRLSRFLPRCERLVVIDRQAFFAFGKRRVALLQIAEFTCFVRRKQWVLEQAPEFGCFGSV